MTDWHEKARRKLADSKFSVLEREEIARELASYLDDLYETASGRGMDKSTATQFALDELHNDARLGPKLYRARKESTMHLNDRTRHFWLPGMSMFLASTGLLAVFQLAGFLSHFSVLWLHGGPRDPHAIYLPLMIYYPWLCVLPFVGAVGACWSRRAGGSRTVQAAVGFLSAFVFVAILLTVLNASFVIAGLTGEAPVSMTLFPECSGAIVSWVVIPGVALLLGVLPFLRDSSARQRVA